MRECERVRERECVCVCEREREIERERGVGVSVCGGMRREVVALVANAFDFLFCLFASCTGTIKENRIGKIKRFASLSFFDLHIFGIGQLILSFFALTCNF